MGAAGSPDLLCPLENNSDFKTSLICVRITVAVGQRGLVAGQHAG
jgi:hypothetical protein